MNRKEILKSKLNISAILFNNNVPVDEAKIIGTFIEDLEQQVKKQKEVIDKIKRLKQFYIKDFEERDITMIPLSNLTKNIDIVLKGVSE